MPFDHRAHAPANDDHAPENRGEERPQRDDAGAGQGPTTRGEETNGKTSPSHTLKFTDMLTIHEEDRCRNDRATGERSQRNSLVINISGLYLYATGAQRQAISTTTSFGTSASRPAISGKG